MAKLNFEVDADLQKLINLRKEVEELKSALKDFDVSTDTKGFDDLNRKYEEATRKLKDYEQQMQNYQRVIEQLKVSNGIIDGARQITEELNNATDVFVEQQLKVKGLSDEIKKLNKSYLSLSDVDKNSQKGSNILTDLKEKTRQHALENEALKRLRKEYSDNIKIEGAASDSLVALRKQLSLLNAEYDRLSATDRKATVGTNLQKQIQALNTEISSAEQATGRYQRNVGNYASSWNGLSVSVQQVARELPSLAVGWNTFFLAISNNLPMLADELKKAAAEYKAFKMAVAAGNNDVAKVAPVWKQLITSIFSWQTALVAAITLLSVYGKDIIEWTKKLFGAGEAIKNTKQLQDELNQSFSKNSGELSKLIIQFKSYQRQWKELAGNLQEQQKFIEENKDAFDSMGVSIKSVRDAENLFVDNTDNFINSLKLRAQATAAQDLATEEYKKAIQKEIEADKIREKASETRKKQEIDATGVIQDTRFGNIKSHQQLVEDRAKSFDHEAEAVDRDAQALKRNADAYFELGKAKEQAADDLLSSSGLSLIHI